MASMKSNSMFSSARWERKEAVVVVSGWWVYDRCRVTGGRDRHVWDLKMWPLVPLPWRQRILIVKVVIVSREQELKIGWELVKGGRFS